MIDWYSIVPKMSPLPSLAHKFLHRYFGFVISSCPYCVKFVPSAKVNTQRSTKVLLDINGTPLGDDAEMRTPPFNPDTKRMVPDT